MFDFVANSPLCRLGISVCLKSEKNLLSYLSDLMMNCTNSNFSFNSKFESVGIKNVLEGYTLVDFMHQLKVNGTVFDRFYLVLTGNFKAVK